MMESESDSFVYIGGNLSEKGCLNVENRIKKDSMNDPGTQ